jgi:7,8-dihydropterin-6-yl-methyl-4-(beta-D-ribofuranosyl)aminobenzene 5'-phosphate synthase
MDECFKREGIDQMLKNREIEALFISHEHFDHFWGIPVTYKYDPTITTYIPEGFYPEGLQYLQDSGHKGKVVTVEAGAQPGHSGFCLLCVRHPDHLPGVRRAVPVFQRQGPRPGQRHRLLPPEHHPVRRNGLPGDQVRKRQLYGVYGGLHISPFEDWDPKYDDLVISLGKYGFQKIGCNHCTGILCAKKFVECRLPGPV